MDDKLVTNGTELPAGAEIPVETWLPVITEFVNQRYNNVLKNLQIPEFIRIIATLEVNHWLVFLFLFIIIIICYLIFIKTNRKAKLKSKSLYIQIDSIYDNYYSRGWLILILVFSFVHYLYYINNHEIIYFKSIFLSFLIMYAFLVFPYSARLLSVRKWKKTTLNLFKSSSDTVFEDYKTQDKQYKWKNKSAEKIYLLHLEKILTSNEISKKELDIYRTELNKVNARVVGFSKANILYFCTASIIAFSIAWNAGGWWWLLFAFFFMLYLIINIGNDINVRQEIENKKHTEITNISTNEDFIPMPPVVSVPTEQKVITPSDPLPQNNSNIKIEPKPKESSSALGVWTFIAFVIAFFAGGWWWVLAIIMGLIWLGNKGENKQENASAQSTAPVINTNIPTNNLSGWAKQLTDICAQYSGNDYFVAELIPAQKLENAMKQYPMPGLVITLIDATLFGSADNGMLIGKKGISWRNKVVVGKSDLCWHDGLYNGNRFTLMTWKYFSKQKIKLENTNIRVGTDNIFDMSGCQFDKTKIIALLNAIQQAYLLQDSSQPLTQTNDVSKNVPQKQKQKYEDVRTVTWVERLTNACLQYSANGFYVGELLPEKNLQHAMKDYPTPDNGKIVALVDTSAFGSIQGMAIGEHGVSWLNRLSHSYSCYWWKDFSKKVISLEDGLLKIGKSGSFELIGDSQQNKTLVAFLQNIQRVYLEQENEYKHPEDIIDQVLSQDSKEQQGINISSDISRQSDSIKVTDNLIDLNTADLDTLLALPGIGVAEAKSLIKQRDVAGPFTSTKQVFDFLNLKPHHANQWKDRVVINETISPQTSTITATPDPEIHRPLGGRTID